MSDTLSQPLAERVEALVEAPPPASPTSTPDAAREAAIQALDDGKTHYTTRPGIVPLREWVSMHLRERYGLNVTVDDITITCGAQEAEFVALKTLVKVGTALLYTGGSATRTYLERYVSLLNLTLTDTPTDAVSALYVGAANDADLLARAVAAGWMVIWHTGSVGDDIGVAAVDGAESRTVIIGELEDTLPGWRVGWMAGSEQASALRAYKQSMTICSPSVSQWAAYGLVSVSHD